MAYDADAITLLRSMPGARWNPDKKCWTVSTKTADLARVIEVCDQLKIEVPASFRSRAELGTENSQEAKQRAATKGLYDFQRHGVEFLALKDRVLLADDMGLGKTVQALVSLPEKARVIVICPAAVKYNWQDEAKKWRKDLTTTVLAGRNSFKLPEEGEIIITNYDILPKWMSDENIDQEMKQALANVHLIADECHLVKNYKTQRSKKVSNLSRLCKSVWFLTGTPLMNKPTDLFGVLCAGDMNVLGSWKTFLRLFNGYKGRFGYHFGSPIPEVPERMKRVMLRRLKKDVLKDLPPKTYQTITVNNIGKALVKELNAAWENWDDDMPYGGLPSFDEFSRMRALLAKDRIPAMLEIVESYEDSSTPLVVFSAHKAPVEELDKRDGWEIITGDTTAKRRHEIVQAFQAGQLKGLGLTIRAGGVGLTLTKASHALFVDLDWTPALNIQAEDRICRIGQTANNIQIMHMQSKHPLDQHVQKLIAQKIEIARKALEDAYKYKAPKLKDVIVPDLKDESDAELKARLDAIEEAGREAERQHARGRVHRILDRERSKATLPEPELTSERKDMLMGALNYMVGRCDGAVTRDNQGFNKPDAAIGHWIAATGMKKDDDVTFRVLERILSRYHRQLGDKFAAIWTPEM